MDWRAARGFLVRFHVEGSIPFQSVIMNEIIKKFNEAEWLVIAIIIGIFLSFGIAKAAYDGNVLFDNYASSTARSGFGTTTNATVLPNFQPILDGYLKYVDGELSFGVSGSDSGAYFELLDLAGNSVATTTYDNIAAPYSGTLRRYTFASPYYISRSSIYTLRFLNSIPSSGTLSWSSCFSGCVATSTDAAHGQNGGALILLANTTTTPATASISFLIDNGLTIRDFPSWGFSYNNPYEGDGYTTEIFVSYASSSSPLYDFNDNLPTGEQSTVSFDKTTALTDGNWTALASLYSVHTTSSSKTISDVLATTEITFTISGAYRSYSQIYYGGGIVPIENFCSFSGLFTSSTLSDIWCYVENGVGIIAAKTAQSLGDILRAVTDKISSVFPLSVIKSFNEDVQAAQATSSIPSLIISGQGAILTGRSFTFLTATTTDWIASQTGFDYKQFFDYAIWIFTGFIVFSGSMLLITYSINSFNQPAQ